MLNKKINRVAVLGSGVMGSRIACHFANIGCEVLLIDISPSELTEDEKKKGLALHDTEVKQRIVRSSLQQAISSKPSPLYLARFGDRIETGNFKDDLKKIESCDWIIEAVSENPAIKEEVYQQVEQFRKPGTLVSSNTSGIPLSLLAKNRTEEFKKHFLGTHFFNPPRYLPLLELIPTPSTDPDVLHFVREFAEQRLGKTTVDCKDTPAFIANRIGVYGIVSLFHLASEIGLSFEEIDKLTGPVLGRPKSATFRTCDVVGLDTLVFVADGLYNRCTEDRFRDQFILPDYIRQMMEMKRLGDKTGSGFYRKSKKEGGKSEIEVLDRESGNYRKQEKVRFAVLDQVKSLDHLAERIPLLLKSNDKAGEFYRKSLGHLFAYAAERVPEISDEPYWIDRAVEAGFGWEAGPFALWDMCGFQTGKELIRAAGLPSAGWLEAIDSSAFKGFYTLENGKRYSYHPAEQKYKAIAGQEQSPRLHVLRSSKTVWSNSGTHILDFGEGILLCEFHTKMNTMGAEVLEGVNKAIEIAERDFRGLVIGNQGANFSAGANLGLVFMLAMEEEWEELDMAVRYFQNTNMRVRYSAIPVVVAPFGLCLGGGCELSLHADRVQAHAETYTGLVEFGVGLIPGGGGTKEFALRLSDSLKEGDIITNALRERFLTIGQAKVSTSAHEAFELGIYRNGIDRISLNRDRLLYDARQNAIEQAESGYSKPILRKNILVAGKSGLGIIQAGANSMRAGHYISEHDQKISEKLGWILCGGDLSSPTRVSEHYLLDLEREAFLSLCGEKKTLERIQAILTTGKPLRN